MNIENVDGVNITKKENHIDWYKISLILGCLSLLISSIVMIVYKTFDNAVAITVLLGFLVLTSNYFVYIGMEKPAKDERLRKIGTISATYSWYITLAFICNYMVLSFYMGREFNAIELFGLVIFIMISTMLIINTYLTYKGDVE